MSGNDESKFVLAKRQLPSFADHQAKPRSRLLKRVPGDETGKRSAEPIHPGPYRIGKNVEDANTYRVGHPLAQRVLDRAKAEPTPVMELTFQLTGSGKNIAILVPFIGRQGWLSCNRLSVRTLEVEEHLLFSALDDDGQVLDDNQCRRLFDLLAEAGGRLGAAFDPRRKDFKLELPQGFADLKAAVIDLLAAYQIERHIRKETDEKPNRLKKEVMLGADFEALWNRIKPRTTYRVEFSTDELVMRAVAGVKKMEKIQPAKIRLTTGRVDVVKGGVASTILSVAEEVQEPYSAHYAVPDVLAYLQNETELTRSTLVRILKESGRLAEFLVNPQRFMDQVASILKYELHRLLVDGIKYERIAGPASEAEWEMVLFKNEELVNLLTALQVKKSVYEYVEYESEVEREFARKLDQREDIRLFIKLPDWFKVQTPVGGYNPDWAVVKHDDETIYLVRETKGTKDFLKLRTTEADKVRCGQRHFEALGVPFAVATTADDV